MSNSIVLHNVSKKYILSQERPILLKNLFLPQKKEEVWALKNVSLTIKKGETVGIIGENGSGKSTLLKIIAGITTPTSGTVSVNGRVASLIELGAGFHQDLTGRENVYLNGTLLGLTKKEIDKKYKDIIDFADIGKFIDQPIRTYSSGMIVRLGFSVAAHLNPDILLIDEILAVGDEEFQRRCLWKLKEFLKMRKTMLVVSHNLNLIRQTCTSVYWIDKGALIAKGNPSRLIEKYISEMSLKPQSFDSNTSKAMNKIFRKVLITRLRLLDSNEKNRQIFQSGEKVFVEVTYKNQARIVHAKFGIVFYSNYGEYLYGLLTPKVPLSKDEGIIIFLIPQLSLLEGRYPITVAVANSSLSKNFDWKEQRLILRVKNKNKLNVFGSVDLNIELKNSGSIYNMHIV